MLGGGGGVRTLGGAASESGAPGRGVPDAAGGAVTGRERTGGGGGPDGRAKLGGGKGVAPAAAGEPPGATAGARGVMPPGVMPGSVVRATCGAGDGPGRGGENDGRGGTADTAEAGDPGSWSLGFGLSVISPRL